MSTKARWWMLTLNNPETETIESLHKQLCADYGTGQVEMGESQTRHIQALFWFRNQKRFGALKSAVPAGHWEPVKNIEASLKYVVKENTRLEGPWTFGELPVKRNSKDDWEEVFNLAKSGKIEEIPAQIRVQHYSNLKRIEKDFMPMNHQTESTRGVWIHGNPGCGKTHMIRENFGAEGGLYLKNNNKWWDGYQGQKFVVLEDVDNSQWRFLVNNMKIWADKYAFIGESKGGQVAPVYQKLFVTSNYSVSSLFEGLAKDESGKNVKRDEQLEEAVTRRFDQWYMSLSVDGTRLLTDGQRTLTVADWVALYTGK
jgi:hypothetical protein